MATEAPLIRDGSQNTASTDFNTKYGYAVKITAARVVGLVSAVTDYAYGILQNKPSSGQAADVALFGICKAYAGGTITAGALLEVNSSGQVITYTSSGGATMIGYSIEAAVVSQIFTMFLFGPRPLTT